MGAAGDLERGGAAERGARTPAGAEGTRAALAAAGPAGALLPRAPLTRAVARGAVPVVPLAANLALALAWGALHAPTLRWLVATFSREQLRLNLALLAGVVLLLAARHGGALRAALVRPPALRALPLALAAALGAGAGLADAALDVHLLAALLFVLATWALAGLYLPKAAWRAGLPGALLLASVLPFGEQASTYLGFSARLFTARVVARALAGLGVAVLPESTVLLLESGVAYVDVPCSGVRSLWTGLVFFLAALWIERRRLSLGAIAAGAGYAGLLVLANVVRVAAIVLLLARGDRGLAAALHEPLGLAGFALASAAAAAVLRATRTGRGVPCPMGQGEPDAGEAARSCAPGGAVAPALARSGRGVGGGGGGCPNGHSLGAAFALALVLLAAGLGRAALVPSGAPRAPLAPLAIALPAEVSVRTVALTDAEAGLFERVGETRAEKLAFSGRGVAGEVVLVDTTSWRAHHPPELCLTSAGLRIDRLEDRSFGPGRAVRVASLDGGRRTAVHWYQSATRTTGDLTERIAAAVTGREVRWVLVSAVLDAPPDDAAIRATYALVAGAVERALTATRPADEAPRRSLDPARTNGDHP